MATIDDRRSTVDDRRSTIHRIREVRSGPEGATRSFLWGLPGYFFICVKVIWNDYESPYDFFLISLANRFNTAYYRLLNTGKWSGGETSKHRLTFSWVWWKRAKCRAPKFTQRTHAAVGTEESFPFLGYFFRTLYFASRILHFVGATESSTGFFEGALQLTGATIVRQLENNSS